MDAHENKIGKILQAVTKVFIIPPFQRSYTWGKDECEELFLDVIYSIEKSRNHYIGNIVHYKGDNSKTGAEKAILIDGQQRLTTLMLFICAIRDVTTDDELKTTINGLCLNNSNSNKEFRVKLKQANDDNEIFNNIIMYGKGNKGKLMYDNYQHFKKWITASDKSNRDIFEAIVDLDIVEVDLEVEKNSLDIVQTIFEKINSSGKALSVADLIRNKLLLSSSIEEQEIMFNNYWSKIETLLTITNIHSFARWFISMKVEKMVTDKTRLMYDEYKILINDSSREKVLSEMKDYSLIYNWFVHFTCPKEEINESIRMLNLLKWDTLKPLLLLIAFKLKDDLDNLYEIIKLFISYLIRYRICRFYTGGGGLEAFSYRLIKSINEKKTLLDVKDFLSVLSTDLPYDSRFPDNNEFMESLMKNQIDTSQARVLLTFLENSETKNIPVKITDITIEHLMPQTLTDWWKEYLGNEWQKIYETNINMLGNLTIMSSGYNSAASNSPWYDKRPLFEKVQFTITSEIYNKFSEWREFDMNYRTRILANRISSATKSPINRKIRPNK